MLVIHCLKSLLNFFEVNKSQNLGNFEACKLNINTNQITYQFLNIIMNSSVICSFCPSSCRDQRSLLHPGKVMYVHDKHNNVTCGFC